MTTNRVFPPQPRRPLPPPPRQAAHVEAFGTLRCTGCGAENASPCGCGVGFELLRPGKAAELFVKEHPQKTDRAIAAEIGVDHKTVAAARQAVGENSPTETRIGQDGKNYKPSKPKPSAPEANGASTSITDADWAERRRSEERARQKMLNDAMRALFLAHYTAYDKYKYVDDLMTELSDDVVELINDTMVELKTQSRFRKWLRLPKPTNEGDESQRKEPISEDESTETTHMMSEDAS
jgi:hypothetical protein